MNILQYIMIKRLPLGNAAVNEYIQRFLELDTWRHCEYIENTLQGIPTGHSLRSRKPPYESAENGSVDNGSRKWKRLTISEGSAKTVRESIDGEVIQGPCE